MEYMNMIQIMVMVIVRNYFNTNLKLRLYISSPYYACIFLGGMMILLFVV
jgi:hypothetical protein